MSLDDLLRPGPDEEPRPRWVQVVRSWSLPVLWTFAASVIVYALFLVVRFPLPYPLIAVICLAGLLIRQSVGWIGEPLQRHTGDLVRSFETIPRVVQPRHIRGGDAMLSGIRRWERELSWSLAGSERFAATAGRLVGEIADERLRQRYGITRASDPERARQIMGEHLWHVTGRLERPPGPRQVLAALDDLERI